MHVVVVATDDGVAGRAVADLVAAGARVTVVTSDAGDVAIEGARVLRVRPLSDVAARRFSLRPLGYASDAERRAAMLRSEFGHAREAKRLVIRGRSAMQRRIDRVPAARWRVIPSLPVRPRISAARESELTFGPMLDELAPDAIVMTDPQLSAVAQRAATRASNRPLVVDDVAALLPHIRPLQPTAARGRRLGIGPANMAGQAWAWAKSVERRYPDVATEVFAVQRGALGFDADVSLSPATFARDTAWQLRWAAHIRASYTHLLIEAGQPVLGTLNGYDFRGDVEALRDSGVRIGLIFHGSDIRSPRRHAELYPYSPFRDASDELTATLQRNVDAVAPAVAAFAGPLFVSTPDLLDDLPSAQWLPVVVDLDVWHDGPPPLVRERPLVVHAPSRRVLKGTELIEPTLRRMEEDGHIAYRRIENVPHASLPALVRDADIVLDHFGIGNYGVLTCEAMASGRVSVSHIHERVRARVADEIPTIEATPDTLQDVLLAILEDRDAARATAEQGPAFVRKWHDGTRSAEILASFLDPEP